MSLRPPETYPENLRDFSRWCIKALRDYLIGVSGGTTTLKAATDLHLQTDGETDALVFDSNQDGVFSGTATVHSNHVMEGYSTGQNVLRSVTLYFQPGATPGTNIDITSVSEGSTTFNTPTITDATDLAKSGSSGSFALDASGNLVTLDMTETVVGVLSASYWIHDINSSSTTETYFPLVTIVSGNLRISTNKRGNSSNVDWTSIMDAGDEAYIQIAFITST